MSHDNDVPNPNLVSILPKINHLRKQTWRPIVGPEEGTLTASKVSGKPWLNLNEEWPKCSRCGEPMQLFFQLNLEQLPEELEAKFGKGLLQLFYCITDYYPNGGMCYELCESWKPFSEGQLVRVIEPRGEPAVVEVPEIKNRDGYYPTYLIVDWEKLDDEYPEADELKAYGVEISDENYPGDYDLPKGVNKLAGWPLWLQDIEYPNCPICNKKMEIVFQIAPDEGSVLEMVPFLSDDVGYITQCNEHKEQVAFNWQN